MSPKLDAKTIAVIVDAVFGVALLLIGRYLSPADADFYTKVFVLLQAPALALIGAYFGVELKQIDVQAMLEARRIDTEAEIKIAGLEK